MSTCEDSAGLSRSTTSNSAPSFDPAAAARPRTYSAAKTVADCFKYRNKIGTDIAVEALKDFTRTHRGGANELARFARICRVSRVMQPYLDAIA